jgi:hypothetical protein
MAGGNSRLKFPRKAPASISSTDFGFQKSFNLSFTKQNSMQYLYTMEFYSATKKNEILSFESKSMELENITLSSEHQKSYVFPHMQIIDPKQIQ